MLGQVGTVFAFGQTGSGKTHTMNGLMDSLIHDLYDNEGTQRHSITFSYMEMLGDTCNDCLVSNDNNKTISTSTVTTTVEEAVEETDDVSSNSTGNVRIGELLDGRVVVRNLSEHNVTTAEEFKSLLAIAKSRRTTAKTERNEQSSRSHGIGIIKINNFQFAGNTATGPSAGILYIVDLAGSERMADSKNHNDARMAETKAINLSLMSLKECIRARTMASKPGCADLHVPFRRSKLTLLMKDCFDISCARLCNTIVLSHVSPIARDIKHSVDTIKYTAPLRVAIQANNMKLETDTRDPALWNHEVMMTWLKTHYDMNKLDSKVLDIASILLPSDSSNGLYLCQMPELTIYSKVISAFKNDTNNDDTSVAILIARSIYSALWMLICDAKTRKRRPNGTIITAEDEEKERQKQEDEAAAKAVLWKLREAQLKTGY
jgi:kinesin family protein 2/24